MRILLVDDERAFAGILSGGLTAEGYTVDVAHDGRHGLLLAQTGVYGVIVLDLMLPQLSGFAVCSALRRGGVHTPILILTAKDGELDQLEALDTGADDYLSKPFSYPILLARIRALTRRASEIIDFQLVVGDLTIDTARRICHRADTEVTLSDREFAVLELLARAQGRAVSKAELLLQLWPGESDNVNLVEVRVSGLRHKIDQAFQRNSLRTIRGSGYALRDDRS